MIVPISMAEATVLMGVVAVTMLIGSPLRTERARHRADGEPEPP